MLLSHLKYVWSFGSTLGSLTPRFLAEVKDGVQCATRKTERGTQKSLGFTVKNCQNTKPRNTHLPSISNEKLEAGMFYPP